jgi:hypothetical protein
LFPTRSGAFIGAMRLGLLTPLALGAALLLPAAPARPADAQAKSADLDLMLSYEGRLIFKVLDIEVEEHASGEQFSADATLTSAGILAALKHIHQHASSRGRLAAGLAQPGVFETQNLAGKTRRRVRTAWTGADVQVSATPDYPNLGDPPASLQQKLAAADPLTVLVGLSLKDPRERTCSRSDLFFDGKQLYALDFGPPQDVPPTLLERQLGLVGHVRCDVRFREVAGFRRKPADKRNQGLQRPINLDFARLGADGPWIISALHAQTPLGWASVELHHIGGASVR